MDQSSIGANDLKIEKIQPVSLLISGAPKLDPVTVIMQDYGPGKGKLILECYSEAWAAYWGAMGNRSLVQFVLGADTDYLANRLTRSCSDDHEVNYVRRIVEALKTALNEGDGVYRP